MRIASDIAPMSPSSTDEGHTQIVDGGTMSVEGKRGFYVAPSMHWITRDGALDQEPPGPLLQLYVINERRARRSVAQSPQLSCERRNLLG